MVLYVIEAQKWRTGEKGGLKPNGTDCSVPASYKSIWSKKRKRIEGLRGRVTIKSCVAGGQKKGKRAY